MDTISRRSRAGVKSENIMKTGALRVRSESRSNLQPRASQRRGKTFARFFARTGVLRLSRVFLFAPEAVLHTAAARDGRPRAQRRTDGGQPVFPHHDGGKR